MTDRFEVPAPSEKAVRECYTAWRTCPEGGDAFELATRAAYAVDLPAIVRAEVERFHKAMMWDASPAANAYLAERFGPQPEEEECCAPSAPLAPDPHPSLPGASVWLCRHPQGHAGPHSWEAREDPALGVARLIHEDKAREAVEAAAKKEFFRQWGENPRMKALLEATATGGQPWSAVFGSPAYVARLDRALAFVEALAMERIENDSNCLIVSPAYDAARAVVEGKP